VIGCLLLLLGSGCRSGGDQADQASRKIELAPLSAMPAYVRDSPRTVQEAYRFAATNPEILKHIPCYCGCNAMDHHHNLDCYVADFEANGQVARFDEHASYCQVCVDITQDVMRLKRSGQSLTDIRNYIDTNYSQYGPPTATE
jgi:hypothetical protein